MTCHVLSIEFDVAPCAIWLTSQQLERIRLCPLCGVWGESLFRSMFFLGVGRRAMRCDTSLFPIFERSQADQFSDRSSDLRWVAP